MERVPLTPSGDPPRNLGAAAVTLLTGVGTALLAAPFIQALALALLAHRVSASPVVVAIAFVAVGMASLALYALVNDNRIRGARGTVLCALVPFVTVALLAFAVTGI
ncbi:MAG: hypothetical protein IT200_15770 [Thermoleophilia bacterium]|nr:hypothetical protein [Thermoleophilia bacterium]